MFEILFFTIPVIFIVLFGIDFYYYVSAKDQNEKNPGTFTDDEIKKRKIILIVLAVVAGVSAVVMVGFMALSYLAVAFM